MKKLVSVLLVLMMVALSCSAFAEDVDLSSWVEVEMTDIGMHFYRPGDMVVGEPDTDNGQVYVAENDDMVFDVNIIATSETSAEEVIANFESTGATVAVNGLADAGLAFDHLLVTVEGNDNVGACIFLGSDGYWYDFEVEAKTENGAYIFGMILGTLSAIE